ncbi:oxidoreductase-like protein [Tuber indicum]|nr:oxidoreductase-like protein [Tuber indicum]
MGPFKRIIPALRAARVSTSAGIQSKQQVHPLHVLLENPITPANTPPPTSPVASDISSKSRVIFGTRLAGPTERREAKRSGGRVVAGVWIPPKPVEPDNCCMSGCVNCTWEVFREDLEEWKGAEGRARAALAKLEGRGGGGGNEGGLWEGFEDIPVGIRAFMEMEKRLKEGKKV